MFIISMNNRIIVKAEYVLRAFQYKLLNGNPYTYVCNCVDIFAFIYTKIFLLEFS